MSERKEPSISTTIIYAMILVVGIMFVFRTWNIGYGWELLACGIAGWNLRRIIWWSCDIRDAMIVKLNEWAKGGRSED